MNHLLFSFFSPHDSEKEKSKQAMIISHKHKFVIVHVPKTGGSTVTNYFKEMKRKYKNLKDDEIHVLWGFEKNGLDKAHLTCKEMKNYIPDDVDLRDYVVYVLVRNPYDRMYSCFLYLKKVRSIKPPVTFHEFLTQCYRQSRRFPIHVKPMTHFCDDHDTSNLNVKFIRTESFDDDFQGLLKTYDLPMSYKNMNVSVTNVKNNDKNRSNLHSHPHSDPKYFKYRNQFDESCLDIVNDMFRDDFRVFDYPMYQNNQE